ncbi:MAG: translation initiation factor IF-2 [Bacillota bacterium]|nr:translation initiation factor IF-2 [Bacillota bacterium]
MVKIRVHELAKEMNISSKEMVNKLQGLGLDVKNHMSTMEDSQASWVRKHLAEAKGSSGKTHSNNANLRSQDVSGQTATRPPKPQSDPQKHATVNNMAKPAQKTNQQHHTQPDNKEMNTVKEQQQINMNNTGMNKQQQPAQRTNQSSGQQQNNQRPIDRNANSPRPAGQTGNRNPGQTSQRPDGQTGTNRNPGQPSQRPAGQTGTNRNPGQPSQRSDGQTGTNRNPGQPSQRSAGQTRNRNLGQSSQRPAGQTGANRNPGQSSQRPAGQTGSNRNPGQPSQRPSGQTGNNRNTGQPSQRPAGPTGANRTPGQTTQTNASPRNVNDNRTGPKKLEGQNKPGQNNNNRGAANNRPAAKRPMPPRKDYSRPQKKGKHKKRKEEVELQTPEMIAIGDSIQVRDLADKLHKNSAEIVKKLMDLGTMVTINQEIDYETVEIICSLFEVKVEREITEEEKILEEIIDTAESLVLRAPIVTVMGHVDHGKTSLLDKVRKADVVSGEAGGITQHIGAYQVTVNENKITFIDTPGHEAFTAMRARGANLTDIVILVVAADDGVMPQTIEAINHIKAAQVPFIVALNKIDKPDINPDKVMQQLTEYGIVAEEWGGETMFIPVSAKTGFGIDTLLEMVLLIAEVNDLKANPNRVAEGLVIEGELDKGKGAVATVLVQKGTLNVGDCLVCGHNWARVRAMTDYRGRKVAKALPSMPVEITGWSDVPEAGGKVQVCDEKIAKEIASLRLNERKIEEQKKSSKVSLDDFFKQMQDAEVKELNLIIKGDVQGSIEALAQSLLRLSTSEVKVKVIHSAVGAITETDVMLASASNGIILGFNVRPDVKARKHAEEENIDVRLYRVIYEAIEDVKKAMTGLLDPEYKEKYLGRAEVRETFKVPNVGTIGGCYVIEGKMQRNAEVRVLRDGVIVFEGKLSSLRRFKDDAKEVMENFECGIGIKDFNDIKEGDQIEDFVMEEVPRQL